MTPRDINNGGCEEFQQDVCKEAPDAIEMCSESIEGSHAHPELPGHCWIFYDGKHYDAEIPEGTEDWKLLPLFVHWVERGGEIGPAQPLPEWCK